MQCNDTLEIIKSKTSYSYTLALDVRIKPNVCHGTSIRMDAMRDSKSKSFLILLYFLFVVVLLQFDSSFDPILQWCMWRMYIQANWTVILTQVEVDILLVYSLVCSILLFLSSFQSNFSGYLASFGRIWWCELASNAFFHLLLLLRYFDLALFMLN